MYFSELIAVHIGHSNLPAEVVSRDTFYGYTKNQVKNGLAVIRVLGNPMGAIKEDHLVWYPIRKSNTPYGSTQFSYRVRLEASDPRFFRRLDSLIRASVRAWVKRHDSFAIQWVKLNEQNRKARKAT